MGILSNYDHSFYTVEQPQVLISLSLIRFQMLKWGVVVIVTNDVFFPFQNVTNSLLQRIDSHNVYLCVEIDCNYY